MKKHQIFLCFSKFMTQFPHLYKVLWFNDLNKFLTEVFRDMKPSQRAGIRRSSLSDHLKGQINVVASKQEVTSAENTRAKTTSNV